MRSVNHTWRIARTEGGRVLQVRTPTPTPPAPGKPPGWAAPRFSWSGSLRTFFWGHHLCFQQFVGPLGDGQFRLQLGDPTASYPWLRLLRRSETWLEASVNSVLASPVANRLVRHTKIS